MCYEMLVLYLPSRSWPAGIVPERPSMPPLFA
jgi:hypothetical protein